MFYQESFPNPGLIIVSTRGPDENPDKISGGMAPNVLGVCEGRGLDVTWVGLDKGMTDHFSQAAVFDGDGTSRKSTKTFQVAGVNVRILAATNNEWVGHKHAKSDEFVWPIIHNRPDLAITLTEKDHKGNDILNTRLAVDVKQTVRNHYDNDTTVPVWVHDYNHCGFARIAKEDVKLENPVYLKLHTPVPDMDVVRQLNPQQQTDITQYYSAISHFDGVSFQSGEDVRRYFEILGLKNPPPVPDLHETVEIEVDGRRQLVGNFTISINVPDVDRKRELKELISPEAKAFEATLVAPVIMINFERADYSKGAEERLEAYKLMNEQHPEVRGKVQIGLGLEASRQDLDAYKNYAERVKALADEINADPELWVEKDGVRHAPVQACPKIPHRDVINLLKQQEGQRKIGTITAVADGANLVCKEFVEAQDPQNAGVLILSDQAGSGREEGFAKHALLYTPDRSNVQELADAMYAAIIMPQKEANLRNEAAQNYLATHGLKEWGDAHFDLFADVARRRAGLEFDKHYEGPSEFSLAAQ